MLEALWSGILLGLLLSVLIGPVFFLLIELSLREGFRSAVFMDIGIILSDGVCILVAYFGMAALLENPKNKLIFILIGSGILFIMGIVKLIPRKKNPEEVGKVLEIQIRRSNPFWLIVKGFFYNFLNPSTIIFWITAVGAAVSLYGAEKGLIAVRFGATLAVVFAVDVTKAWFAKKMRQFLSPDKMRKANMIVGVVFVIFSIILVYRAYTGHL